MLRLPTEKVGVLLLENAFMLSSIVVFPLLFEPTINVIPLPGSLFGREKFIVWTVEYPLYPFMKSFLA